MSFVADFIDDVVDAFSGAVETVGDTIGAIVDSALENPIVAAAAIAAAIYTAGASLAAEGVVAAADAAAYLAATDASAGLIASDAFATVAAESLVSSSTWAAFGNAASTADVYAAATQSAINTSVADYAAAAVAGESVGAASAFTMLPVSTLGPAVSAGFLETALEFAKGAKKAVDTVQIVNNMTQQKSIVPRNAPVPAGWAVDGRWSPSLGDTGKFVYDPATGALAMQVTESTDTAALVPASGNLPPLVALVAAAAAIFYWMK